MNKTIRKQLGVFLAAAVLSLLAPLDIVFAAEAGAPSETRDPPGTATPAQQEETTSPSRGQEGPLVSAPSATTPEEQKKTAPGAVQQEGEKASTPQPQETGGPQAEQPEIQGPLLPGEQKITQKPQEPGGPQAEQPEIQGPLLPGEQKITRKPVPGAKPGAETTIVDVVHGGISHSLLSSATWLDSFFGNRRYNSEANPSYIRVRYNMFLEHKSAPLLKPDLEARLILPQLRDKTHIVIAGTPKEENPFSAVQANTTGDQAATTEERGVTTGLSYAPRQTATESFFVRAGVKFSPKGADFTMGPLYRVLFPFPSGWSLRFIEDVLWRSKEGWKSTTTVDLERPLPHDLFFRASTDWQHAEHMYGYIYAVSFSVSQPLSSTEALQYSWVNILQTRPVHELEEVDLRVSYRKRIWRDWLYYEIMPQYRFPRNRAFEATPGILFRLDMLFGSLAT